MRTETARTVTTYGERSQILVVVCVVGLSEEGNQRETFAETIGQLTACTCAGPHVVGIQNGQFVALGTAHLVVHAVDLGTHHQVGTVLAFFYIIGGNGIPHPPHSVLLLALHGRFGAHHLTIGDRIGEETLLLLGVVHTQGGADHEILERRDTQMHIAEHTPLCVLVVFGIINHAQWILTLRVGTEGLGILAVLSINGEVGVKLQGMLQHAAGSIYSLRAVDGKVLT